jgi:hypothetical protein
MLTSEERPTHPARDTCVSSGGTPNGPIVYGYFYDVAQV